MKTLIGLAGGLVADRPSPNFVERTICNLSEKRGRVFVVTIPGITMAELERIAILQTLDAVDGWTNRAAAILAISQRKNVSRARVGLSDPGRKGD